MKFHLLGRVPPEKNYSPRFISEFYFLTKRIQIKGNFGIFQSKYVLWFLK